MTEYTIELDPETEKLLTLCLITNVENTVEIRQKVLNGNLRCCILKASLIVDPFQVVVAANKAIVADKFKQLTTRTLFTEILFNLSLSKNITQSLLKFGIDDSDKNILVALIHNTDNGDSVTKQVLSSIKGEELPISKLKEFTDTALVKKTYKIDDLELKVSSLTDLVVSKISCKDFASG